jgi:hypothetical protein
MAVHRRRWQVWWNLWKACAGDREEVAVAEIVTVPVELGTVVVVAEADTGGTDLDLESNR